MVARFWRSLLDLERRRPLVVEAGELGILNELHAIVVAVQRFYLNNFGKLTPFLNIDLP